MAAVVSVAGAVGGSPLANDAEQYQADLLRHFPGATCDSGDGGGVDSLRPAVRRAWLAQNPLPAERADLLGGDLAAARSASRRSCARSAEQAGAGSTAATTAR